jgi:hypothetical protein
MTAGRATTPGPAPASRDGRDGRRTADRRLSGGRLGTLSGMLTRPVRSIVVPAHHRDVAGMLALVGSGLFASYVSYERQGTRWFAGNVRASVVLDRRGVRWTADDRTGRVPLSGRCSMERSPGV